jgi:hypothetical protein
MTGVSMRFSQKNIFLLIAFLIMLQPVLWFLKSNLHACYDLFDRFGITTYNHNLFSFVGAGLTALYSSIFPERVERAVLLDMVLVLSNFFYSSLKLQ